MKRETDKTFIRHELQRSIGSNNSTILEIATNTNSGESKIWLSYKVSEVVELNGDNLKEMKEKFKQLNPSSGWVVSIDKLTEIINE